MRTRFWVEVEVHDEEALRDYVQRRWWATLGVPPIDGHGDDYSVGQLVLEALVLVNENPSADEYGLEITNCGHSGSRDIGGE